MYYRTLIALIVFGCSLEAAAYVVKTSPSGEPVRWFEQEVQIVLDPSLEILGEFDDVAEVIADAFDIWVEQSVLPLEFDLYVADCDEEWEEDDRINCFSATEGAIAEMDDIGAKTVITYTQSSGQILHVEIVFSGAVGEWSTGYEEFEIDEFNRIDLGGVALHEIGHLVGLDHSDVKDSVMFPTLAVGDESRNELHEDDIAGIGELYAGFEELEPWDSDHASGVGYCSVSRVASRGGAASILMLLIGALPLLRRNRKRVDQSPCLPGEPPSRLLD